MNGDVQDGRLAVDIKGFDTPVDDEFYSWKISSSACEGTWRVSPLFLRIEFDIGAVVEK